MWQIVDPFKKGARPRPETRQEQILTEAVRLIGERGYHGFGIRELADRCGITSPAVFHHFGTKEGLLLRLLEKRDQDVMQVVRQEPSIGDSSAQARSAILRFFRDTAIEATRRPELLRLFTILKTESLNADHPAHSYFRKRGASVRDAYSRLIAPFVSDPQSCALHLLAAFEGLQEEWLRSDQTFDLAFEVEEAVRRALGPGEPAPAR